MNMYNLYDLCNSFIKICIKICIKTCKKTYFLFILLFSNGSSFSSLSCFMTL